MAVIDIMALLLPILLILLVVGIVAGWFGERGRIGQRAAPSVAVVRLGGYKDGHEDVRLLVNGQIIRHVSDEGTRAADYQAQVEDLEKLASSLAAALGVEVWLRRADASERE
jgi:hypothetical protein